MRNPVGSSHAPSSPGGCTIFVKLCQMRTEESEQTVIETEDLDGARLGLFVDETERVDLVRLQPGEALPLDGSEVLLLEGSAVVDGRRHAALSWLRQPSGSALELRCLEAATLWRKRGHLPSS